MKVILTADVYKHGVAGEVVSVADGFARNYLIPKGLAVKASAGASRYKMREQVSHSWTSSRDWRVVPA